MLNANSHSLRLSLVCSGLIALLLFELFFPVWHQIPMRMLYGRDIGLAPRELWRAVSTLDKPIGLLCRHSKRYSKLCNAEQEFLMRHDLYCINPAGYSLDFLEALERYEQEAAERRTENPM